MRGLVVSHHLHVRPIDDVGEDYYQWDLDSIVQFLVRLMGLDDTGAQRFQAQMELIKDQMIGDDDSLGSGNSQAGQDDIRLLTPTLPPSSVRSSQSSTNLARASTRILQPTILVSIATGSSHSRLRATFSSIASVTPPKPRGPPAHSDVTTVISGLDAKLDEDRVCLDQDDSADYITSIINAMAHLPSVKGMRCPTLLQRLGKRRPSLISIDELDQHIKGQRAALENENSQGHLEDLANSISHSRLAIAFPGFLAGAHPTGHQVHSNAVDTIHEFNPRDRTLPRGLGDAKVQSLRRDHPLPTDRHLRPGVPTQRFLARGPPRHQHYVRPQVLVKDLPAPPTTRKEMMRHPLNTCFSRRPTRSLNPTSKTLLQV
ncbi:hypothetical protein IWZ01DRAFT_527945, partial [Phyllosticta capitalensis]